MMLIEGKYSSIPVMMSVKRKLSLIELGVVIGLLGLCARIFFSDWSMSSSWQFSSSVKHLEAFIQDAKLRAILQKGDVELKFFKQAEQRWKVTQVNCVTHDEKKKDLLPSLELVGVKELSCSQFYQIRGEKNTKYILILCDPSLHIPEITVEGAKGQWAKLGSEL